MKLGYKVLIALILAVVVLLGVLMYSNRPISKEMVNEEILDQLKKTVKNDGSISSALLTISSGETGYFKQFAVGTVNKESSKPAKVNSPYYSASIGKTMCSTLCGMLVDEGKINYDDRIDKWLGKDILEGLFVLDGKDYSSQVTIRQLLNHTSGVASYFDGPVRSGQRIDELIVSNPDRRFTPKELVAFARDNQFPVGKPGKVFNYSDTGYVLLGLILEKVEGKPYDKILNERIFVPLKMKDSYLIFHDERHKKDEILGVYASKINFINKESLSIDWSGGGIITTMDDLLIFMKALVNGKLVSKNTFQQMTNFDKKYDKGIRYGMGMMYFDFSELSFMLGDMSDVYGGIGSTGTFMLYDKAHDTYFIANFGSLEFMKKSVEELVKIRLIYDRMIK